MFLFFIVLACAYVVSELIISVKPHQDFKSRFFICMQKLVFLLLFFQNLLFNQSLETRDVGTHQFKTARKRVNIL